MLATASWFKGTCLTAQCLTRILQSLPLFVWGHPGKYIVSSTTGATSTRVVLSVYERCVWPWVACEKLKGGGGRHRWCVLCSASLLATFCAVVYGWCIGCPTVPQKLPTLPFLPFFSSVFLFLSLAFAAAAAASPPRHTLPSIHRFHSINPVNLPIHPYTYIHYIAVSAVLPPVNRSLGSDLPPIFFTIFPPLLYLSAIPRQEA